MARALIIAALLLLSSTVALAADAPCGPYSDMTARLQKEHKEQLLGRGIDAVGRMLEVWGSQDNGWTILLVRPSDMVSCLMLVGQKGTAWQTVEPQYDGPKS